MSSRAGGVFAVTRAGERGGAPAPLGRWPTMRGMNAETVRRIVARPDWPLLSGLGLAVVAVLEALAYTAGGETADGSVGP